MFSFIQGARKCLHNIRLIYKCCSMDWFSAKIFFLSAACGVCDRSQQYIKELTQNHVSHGFQLRGISHTGPTLRIITIFCSKTAGERWGPQYQKTPSWCLPCWHICILIEVLWFAKNKQNTKSQREGAGGDGESRASQAGWLQGAAQTSGSLQGYTSENTALRAKQKL